MFEVFESEASRIKKSHLKNLVSLAKLDGHVSKEEFDFLLKVGARNGVNQTDIRKMISMTTTVNVTKPDNDSERFEIIYDLIQMILADGKMDENELDFAIDLAIKLGFRPAISGVLVRKIALDIVDGHAKEVIYDKVDNFLKLKPTKKI
jgi:uncharacterized tellurite resistance protein B-like protein